MKRRAFVSIVLIPLAVPGIARAADAPPPAHSETELIWRTQLLLSEVGLYDGPIDGKMSEKTTAAIKRFQSMRGVEVDGKVTRLLLNMIDDSKKP